MTDGDLGSPCPAYLTGFTCQSCGATHEAWSLKICQLCGTQRNLDGIPEKILEEMGE